MRPSAPPGFSIADTNENLLARIGQRIGLGFKTRLFDILRSSSFSLDACIGDLEFLFDSCAIRTAAGALRDEADSLTSNRIELRGHLDWLAGNGSSREQTRQVRYVVETFYVLEPVLAVAAVAARELLAGRSPAHGTGRTACPPGPIVLSAEIDFGDEAAAAFFPEIARGRPTHAFVRALAVWPDYAAKVQQDLSPEHRASLARIPADLQSRVKGLVFQLMTGVSERNRAGPPQLLELLDDCVNASCEVIPLIAVLRRGFIQDEIKARRRRSRK